MNNISLQKASLLLMLSWNGGFYAMDPATEEVGRKIQKVLDENAQKKQAMKAQNNSKEVPLYFPNLQAYTDYYLKVVLPQAARDNSQKNTQEGKFGRGSSGESGTTTITQPTSNQGPIGRGASSPYDDKKAKL